MNCLKCGAALQKKMTAMPGDYAGEKFAVATEAMVCPSCRYATLHATQIDGFRTKLADAYRNAHKLLTSQEIREIRSRLGMSQDQFARYLGVGIASVKRWELGRAQDQSSNELIRLKSSVPRAEENLAAILFQHGGEADEYSGGRPFSLQRLSGVILFFLEKAREAGKRIGSLHTNKLCWYADTENYRRYSVSITGCRYAKLPLGPVLDEYRLIFSELQTRGVLSARNAKHLEPLVPFNPDDFSTEEIEILNHVWLRFRNRLGSIISDSHNEIAWKQTPHAGLISFALVSRKKERGTVERKALTK